MFMILNIEKRNELDGQQSSKIPGIRNDSGLRQFYQSG